LSAFCTTLPHTRQKWKTISQAKTKELM
jgi:hypothetical protein